METKVGKFDADENSIRTWLPKYKVYSEMFEWTDKVRIDSLSFFLDSGLVRVVQSKETTSFKEIEDRLFQFVDDLLLAPNCSISHEHMVKMINKFNQFKFTKKEKRFWVGCFCSDEKIRKYYEEYRNGHKYRSYYDDVLCKIISRKVKTF